MQLERSSGILMPISALPSPYGIGTLGKEAHAFVDFLHEAGQKYWQLLPMGPAGYGGSPYSSLSSFAGNPYYIDPVRLEKEGLLLPGEAEGYFWGDDPRSVDYGAVFASRSRLLKQAFLRAKDREGFAEFCQANEGWLPDYSLFMALKRHFGMKAWTEWPDRAIRLHQPQACEKWRRRLREEIGFYSWIQYMFFRQWEELRSCAADKGVLIIGDIPVYVPMDSADVWSEPQWFQLDERNLPTEVSGVPPDYFNEDGQLWGNPLYRWDAMKADGYGWWIRRVGGAFRFCDVLRIDHFRGLESYWAVPQEEKTARNGRWVKGPGMDFVGALCGWFHDRSFIAEDLGFLTPEVRKLLADSGLPGMKVLQFAFDPHEASDYLPHNYPRHCVCYTGTHDNETLSGWLLTADREVVVHARRYLGLNRQEGYAWGIIRGGMCSAADLFVAQMQDYLGLGSEARMNRPGQPDGNWRWRVDADSLSHALAQRIRDMTILYGRAPAQTDE